MKTSNANGDKKNERAQIPNDDATNEKVIISIDILYWYVRNSLPRTLESTILIV
jgi:hypothetical protein